MRTILATVVLCAAFLACSACERAGSSEPTGGSAPVSVTTATSTDEYADPGWSMQLREVAAAYKTWQRVSDQANYSPVRCIFLPPTGAQNSGASDGTPHGRKLYFLYAKDHQTYLDITYPMGVAGDTNDPHPTNLVQPTGQVIVKEAFHPVPATAAEAKAMMTQRDIEQRRTIPSTFIGTGDNLNRMGDLQGLYVMLKTPPASPGTDAGWVYATITPAGEITAAGRIESCMECHVDAPHDRLHGAQWHWRLGAVEAFEDDPAHAAQPTPSGPAKK